MPRVDDVQVVKASLLDSWCALVMARMWDGAVCSMCRCVVCVWITVYMNLCNVIVKISKYVSAKACAKHTAVHVRNPGSGAPAARNFGAPAARNLEIRALPGTHLIS